MKATTEFRGLFGAVARRLLRRRALRRLRREFADAEQDALGTMTVWRPSFAYSKARARELRKRLARVRPELETALLHRKIGPDDSYTDSLRKVAAVVRELTESTEREQAWLKRAHGMRTGGSEVWQVSASFPGGQFAREMDRKKQELDSILNRVGELDQTRRIDEALQRAEQCLAYMRSQVRQAEELTAGLPELGRELACIDEMGAQQSVALEECYRNLVKMRGEIEINIREGRYAAGHRLLGVARDACGALRADLEKRYRLAREEVDLWLRDREVAERYGLAARFPGVMGSSELQEWAGIRLEIARLVTERASAARRAYSGLNPRKRRLQLGWVEVSDWDRLEAFSRGCRETSKYP